MVDPKNVCLLRSWKQNSQGPLMIEMRHQEEVGVWVWEHRQKHRNIALKITSVKQSEGIMMLLAGESFRVLVIRTKGSFSFCSKLLDGYIQGWRNEASNTKINEYKNHHKHRKHAWNSFHFSLSSRRRSIPQWPPLLPQMQSFASICSERWITVKEVKMCSFLLWASSRPWPWSVWAHEVTVPPRLIRSVLVVPPPMVSAINQLGQIVSYQTVFYCNGPM